MATRIRLYIFSLLAGLLMIAGQLFAIIPTWTGLGDNDSFTNPDNWNPAPVPAEGGDTIDVVFGNVQAGGTQSPYVSDNITLHDITFTGTSNDYSLNCWYSLALYGNITAGDATNRAYFYASNLALSPGVHTFSSDGAQIEINANMTETAGSPASLLIQGTGIITLGDSNSSFSGGVTVDSGATLALRSNPDSSSCGSIGTGTLTLKSDSTLATDTYNNYNLNLANAVSLEDGVTFSRVPDSDDNRLNFAGNVTVAPAAVTPPLTVHLKDATVFFRGTLDSSLASTAITFDNTNTNGFRGIATLAGTTGPNITNVTANNTAVIFANPLAVPSTLSIQAINNGYIGVGVTGGYYGTYYDPTPVGAAQVLAQITDKTHFSGTFGFDTDPYFNGGSPWSYGDNVDFTGFTDSNFRIGSATSAVLYGTITPPALTYRFGNSGGTLEVQSALEDQTTPTAAPRSVEVVSTAHEPFTLRLTGENTYTGGTSATQSAVIFSPEAIPATGNFTLGTGGYIGLELDYGVSGGDPAVTGFLSRFSGSTTGFIGFDSSNMWGGDFGPSGSGSISDLNLSTAPALGVATSSYLKLAGNLTLPAGATAYRFAGYKGGWLEVQSPLTGSRSVIIGDPNVPATFADKESEESASVVLLAGNNSYTGGTTLYSGALGVLNNTALGTGALTVEGPNETTYPDADPAVLVGFAPNLNLVNDIVLNRNLEVFSVGGDEEDSLVMDPPTGSGMALSGVISGSGGLILSEGDLQLLGANTYTGGTFINYSVLVGVGSDSAFGTGTGTITLGSESECADLSLRTISGPRTIANPIDAMSPGAYLGFEGGAGKLTLGGPITLYQNLRLSVYGNNRLEITGNIGEIVPNASVHNTLNVWGEGAVVLKGTNNIYTGGTWAQDSGIAIFGSTDSIPEDGTLQSTYSGGGTGGYIGLETPPADLQTEFIDKFNRMLTTGTIGFDTDPTSATPNTFPGNINLGDPDGDGAGVAFNPSVRLGSATSAVLSGTITPQVNMETGKADTYRFGGGGGTLEVSADLSDPDLSTQRSVAVDSPSMQPLTLRLTGTNNTYTGGTWVTQSAVIFPSTSALPPTSEGGDLHLGTGGYIGLQLASNTQDISTFLSHFPASNSTGFIGFDSTTENPTPTLTDLDLGGFIKGESDSGLGVATTTSLTLDGTITLPEGESAYRFSGYKGGHLTVASDLTDQRSLIIGDVATPATNGDAVNNLRSVVTLTGNNTYTGGTDLYAGRLNLGGNSVLSPLDPVTNPPHGPIGTGTLTVWGSNYGIPGLSADSSGLALENNITLRSDLSIEGGNDFTLSGTISNYSDYEYGNEYYGGLVKNGTGTLTLSGSNSFGYWGSSITIHQGGVIFKNNYAAGQGPLGLMGAGTPFAEFTTSAPEIYGLFGDATGGQLKLADNSHLTIYQDNDGIFRGFITGTGASLELADGDGPLTLEGANDYSGGTMISGGYLIANNADGSATGPGPITVNWGTLQIGTGGTTGSVAGSIYNDDEVYFNRSDDYTYGGSISGWGYVEQEGTGTLTFSGRNTYYGDTYIDSGTLADGAADAFSPNSYVYLNSGATLQVNFNETIPSISDYYYDYQMGGETGGKVSIASGANLTLTDFDYSYSGSFSNNGKLTFAYPDGGEVCGTISGSGSVVQNGWGLYFYGANTYTGGTTLKNGAELYAFNESGSATGTGPITIDPYSSLYIGDYSYTGSNFGAVSGPIINNGYVGFDRNDTISYGGISGSGVIDQYGGGTLQLTGTNDYSGPTWIYNGTLTDGIYVNDVLTGADNAFSAKSIVYLAPTDLNYSALDVYFNETIGGLAADYDYWEPGSYYYGRVCGPVKIDSGKKLTLNVARHSPNSYYEESYHDHLYFGSITGGGALVKTGPGYQFLAGENTYTGGTTVQQGALIFDSISSIPTTGTLTASYDPINDAVGYIGLASEPESIQSQFLDRFDKANTSGLIGFDTNPFYGGFNSFDGDIDLTGFNASVRLGSATNAALYGNITPQDTAYYRFGGGGGFLQVDSGLSNDPNTQAARSLVADSPAWAPLTVQLLGENTYTGGTSATQSAVIFAPQSLPATGSLTLGTGGYIGQQLVGGMYAPPSYSYSSSVLGSDPAVTNFLFRFPTTTSAGYIGFDSDEVYYHSQLSDGANIVDLNLSTQGFNSPTFGIATSSFLNLSGTLTLPAGATAYRFAGYKGGMLSVHAPLTGSRSVIIGDPNPNVLATIGDPYRENLSMVTLSGKNTYAGGTTLYGGGLGIGNDQALGTGALTIAGPDPAVFPEAPAATLVGMGYGIKLANDIVLNRNLEIWGSGGLGPNSVSALNGSPSSGLTLAGMISGSGGLTLGYGEYRLLGSNTYSGGTTIEYGAAIGIGNANSFGTSTGKISLGRPSDPYSETKLYLYTLNTLNGQVTVANPIEVNGEYAYLYYEGRKGALTLSGDITLHGYGLDLYLQGGSPLNLTGGIGEADPNNPSYSEFDVRGSGTVKLTGTNTYTGGTWVYDGRLIFGDTSSIPAMGPLAAYQGYDCNTGNSTYGYIGLSKDPATPSDLQKLFIDRFDRYDTYGTIGFDTDPALSTPNTFSGDINLDYSNTDYSFNSSVRLGSATTTADGTKPGAILTGTITPQYSQYRFGGGGGTLEVDSALVDGQNTTPKGGVEAMFVPSGNFSLSADSPARYPLTLVLAGANTYTGGTTATQTAVIFGNSGALPATGNLTLGTGGYIGLQLAAHTLGNDASISGSTGFLSRFSSPSTGFIGFDSPSGYTYTITDLDLNSFTSSGFGVATTTNLTLAGTFTLPSGSTVYSFAGYKGGQLTVSSLLADGTTPSPIVRSVTIGDTNVPATYGTKVNDQVVPSEVRLDGANTYSGGTSLLAGKLILGLSSVLSPDLLSIFSGPVGTGPLTVGNNSGDYWYDGMSDYSSWYDRMPMRILEAGVADLTLANSIVLRDNLRVDGVNSFTLSGSISGSYGIYKSGSGALTLSGNNTFSGGIYIAQDSEIIFDHNYAAGNGPLALGGPLLGALATFNTDLPKINDLSGDAAADRIDLASGSTLTIVQYADSVYSGTITGDNAIVNVEGSGTLRLDGSSSTYSGGTVLNGGTVIAATRDPLVSTTPLGTGPISFSSGGRLGVANGMTLTNSLSLESSGEIFGMGTLAPTNLPVVSNSFKLSPGSVDSLNRIGTLSFGGSAGLAFGTGGTMVIDMMDPYGAPGTGFDTLVIAGGLDITATTAEPFTLRLVSYNPSAFGNDLGYVPSFDPTTAEFSGLNIVTANGGITNFDPAKFVIDTSSFFPTPVDPAHFFLTATSNEILLNFTPVPEPSTYALILLGLGVVLLPVLRRRRG
ncbi:MAG: autotransporter-associated beta strand repeat-containing protein [Opitutaceae bacterium]|nr:autotransporter-associated beta strand repeat-containing protein [Opitutaceae bacterium]